MDSKIDFIYTKQSQKINLFVHKPVQTVTDLSKLSASVNPQTPKDFSILTVRLYSVAPSKLVSSTSVELNASLVIFTYEVFVGAGLRYAENLSKDPGVKETDSITILFSK